MATNAPESEALTVDERSVFENARQAGHLLRKSVEVWLVLGKSVVLARQIADRKGGRQTFQRLIEQQGLAPIIDKSTATRLLKIMDPENLPHVIAWHQTLTPRQQIDWAAPTTILKHCPHFNKPKAESDVSTAPRKKTLKQTESELSKALNENARLREHIREVEAARAADAQPVIHLDASPISAISLLINYIEENSFGEKFAEQLLASDPDFEAVDILELVKQLSDLNRHMKAVAKRAKRRTRH